MSNNIKTVPTNDYEDVVTTVSKYVEGLRVGSVTGVSQAFHNDAVMYGFTNGELLGGPTLSRKTGLRLISRHESTYSLLHRQPRWCVSTWRRMRSAQTIRTSTRSSRSMAPGISSPKFITCTKDRIIKINILFITLLFFI